MEMKKVRLLVQRNGETIHNTVKQLNNLTMTTLEVPHARNKKGFKDSYINSWIFHMRLKACYKH